MNDENSEKVTDQDRVTALGAFLRKTSLDELPQLINVLMGDMSFVGPRPLLVEYLIHYNLEERKRHFIKPGITGLAQVYGRNEIDWGKRLKMDVSYVNKMSFMLDIKILLRTCFVILKFKKTEFKGKQAITFTEYATKR